MTIDSLIKKYEDKKDIVLFGGLIGKSEYDFGVLSQCEEILTDLKALKEKTNTKAFSCLTINNENHGQNAKAIFIEDLIGKEE